MRPHQKLDLWRRAIKFVVSIYRITERFPKEEKFGLTSQVRRAAVSIAANIAEGAARTSTKEFLQFLSVSQGSASEADTELVSACELRYLIQTEYEYFGRELNDIGR